MSVKDVFSARLLINEGEYTAGYGFLDPVYEDISSGIINVDILFGSEFYEGPYQQIDTGQFTIVTRNPNLDPKVNPNIKYNSVIDFMDERLPDKVFFRGYVTEINVEYQRDDFPIITINGTDAFGVMQRTLVSQDLVDQMIGQIGVPPEPQDANGMSLYKLLLLDQWYAGFKVTQGIMWDVDFEYNLNGIPGQLQGNATLSDQYASYAPSRLWPEVGETYLEVFNKHTQTNLNYCSLVYEANYPRTTKVQIYPFAKYNPFYYAPMIDPALEYPNYNFSSNPADARPYKAILIDNGYKGIMNSMSISNEYRTRNDTTLPPDGTTESTTETFGLYVSADSNAEYGSTRANLSTTMPEDKANNTEMQRYARDVFQVVAFPSDEIQQIVFDNARLEDVENQYSYSGAKLNQFTRIKHQVDETETIDRFYDICGVRHNISANKWEMVFTFKPSQQEIAYTYQNQYGEYPSIQMNALTGDANFNFTATLTGFNPANIDSVLWCLNGTNSDVVEQWFYTQDLTDAGILNRYKDEQTRTGLTQTWNFDDDGILAPSIPTGGYGPGEWHVIAYVFLKNGWIVAPQVKLTVGTPEVEADFLWTQNQTNNFGQVTFTDDSHNNEIEEPDSYLWDFGDGNTSTLKNPVHTYDPDPSETEYDVSLTVYAYGPGGTKVYNTKTITITLIQPTLTSDFSFIVDEQTVTFVNLSQNVGLEEPDAYLWEFGDGTISTEKNPIKTFASIGGLETDYEVTLTIKDIWERTDSVTKTVTVEGTDSTGNFGVRYIRLRIDTYTPEIGRYNGFASYRSITPIMNYFKAITSTSNINLVYLKPIKDFNNAYQIYGTINGVPNPKTAYFRWLDAADDGVPLVSEGSELFLTRNPSGLSLSNYGLGAFRDYKDSYVSYDPTYWELVIDIGSEIYSIKDMIVNFRDMLSTSYATPFMTSDFYPRVWVDVANTLGNLNNLPSGTKGTPIRDGNWVNVGYFQLNPGKMDPTQPANTRTEVTKTMTATRPMPLNVPYFTYTFNEKIVNFTSIETADSYLWTFGDGTTSTLKDPVKTYSNYGTYNVTLQVTNGGVVTRTTTEPVIVEQRKINQFPFRYVKFVQNEHTGTHPWDTPILRSAAAEYQNYPIAANNVYLLGTMRNTTEQFSTDFIRGTGGSATLFFDPNTGTTADRQRLTDNVSTINPGMRVKSMNAQYKTGWTTILDYGTSINKATNFRLKINRSTSTNQGGWAYDQTQPTVAAGISYSVYITDYVGSSLDPNAVTWTQVGTITPGTIPATDNFYTYKLDGINNLPG